MPSITNTSSAQSSLNEPATQALVESLLEHHTPGLHKILIVGEGAVVQTVAEAFRKELPMGCVACASIPELITGSSEQSERGLVVCLHAPMDVGTLKRGSLGTVERWSTLLAARSSSLFFAPLNLYDDPLGCAESLARWLGALAEVSLIYDPDATEQLDLRGAVRSGFLLRRTDFDPQLRLGHLSLGLQTQHRARSAAQRRSVLDDRRAALLTHRTLKLHQELVEVQDRVARLEHAQQEWAALQSTPGYALMQSAQRMRAQLAPVDSHREQLLETVLGWAHITGRRGLGGLVRHLWGEVSWRTTALGMRFAPGRYQVETITVEPVQPRPPVIPHADPVDIVICVHNALSDVRPCLSSVLVHTRPPYRLIIVDDGSDEPTAMYLRNLTDEHQHVELLRSEEATGYTFAANRGLRHSTANTVLLLNSDTIVTDGWLDRMIACAESGPQIGMVGPLSNTASWQSVPEYSAGSDWAENPLPADVSLTDWAGTIGRFSDRLYPPMPLLNGFCLLIRRELIDDIGFFDEETFGDGYGEENDYALRARKAGWHMALADDVYIHHAQSRSYSHERRRLLSEQAGEALAVKHGQTVVNEAVHYCTYNPVLEGIRARIAVQAERISFLHRGREHFGGRRVLFVLPVDSPGGGANVVISEARAMQHMGVEVAFFNTHDRRQGFERGYPNLDIPVLYGNEEDLPRCAEGYDAVIATYHASPYWMVPLQRSNVPDHPVLGYYVQDFEAYFFPEGTDPYDYAAHSYSVIPEMRCFTKTSWNQQVVREKTGVHCDLVGPSVEIDQFRPRPRENVTASDEPLHVVGMVRPHSPRRSPELTMRLLRDLHHRFGKRVYITVFGVKKEDPGLADLPQDFHWRLAGVLDPARIVSLLAAADIFVDFSTYQAMGLTAMEAMASGNAVVVPRNGGATAFARHEQNALVVDTSSEEACWDALVRLVVEDELRESLRRNAIHSICRFYPERPAFNILSTLFGRGPQ